MAVTNHTQPVDRVVTAYNAILAIVWAVHAGSAPYVPWIVAAHLAALALPWLFGQMPRRPAAPTIALRNLYPLVLLAGFWPEVDLLRSVLGPHFLDGSIAALDHMLFGTHLHEVWMAAMHQTWWSETMFFAYVVYYPLVFVPVVIMAIRGRTDAVHDMTFRLMLTYLACYLFYVAFPVLGPHYLTTPHPGAHTNGLFYQIAQGAVETGSTRGAAFPSSHVAGAVTIAVLAWRWLPRWAAWGLTVEAVGVLMATVYTQNHYAIDSLAGLVWALALQLAVAPALLALFARPRRSQLTPVFPDFTSVVSATPPTGGGT